MANFYQLELSGDVRPYRVKGFAEPPGLDLQARMFILPTLTVRQSDVKYSDEVGNPFTPGVYSQKLAGRITIAARATPGLPTESQWPAIAAVLDGTTVAYQIIPAVRDLNGNPAVYQPATAHPQIMGMISMVYNQYGQKVAAQKALGEKYKDYLPQQAAVNQLTLTLIVDGEKVASRTMLGSYLSTAATLPALTLVGPTLVQQNLIKNGDFEIEVSYKILDTKVSSISVDFNVRQMIDEYLAETQDVITKNKSSGFQVFHIGKRKSKITTSINQQVDSKLTAERKASTRIVMYDATDAMIDEFDATFYPQISKENVIQAHLAASATASAAGDTNLAKVHADYAASLQSSNAMAEVDAIGAAAALNKKDYAGFVARGVRASDNNDIRANHFRRVVHERSEVEDNTKWNQARIVTTQRETSDVVRPEGEDEPTARIGLCDLQPFQFGAVLPGPYGPVSEMRQTLLITCVQENSPALAAGLLPGMVISAIDNRPMTSTGAAIEVLDAASPGDELRVNVFEPRPGTPFTQERAVTVKLKRGLPRSLISSR